MRELARIALRGTEPARDRDHVADLLERLVYGSGTGEPGRSRSIDQLEELWTTCSDASRARGVPRHRGRAVRLHRPHATSFLVVLADYVTELTNHPSWQHEIADRPCGVGTPSPAKIAAHLRTTCSSSLA